MVTRSSQYAIGDGLFRVLYGDITTLNVDVLVSSDDNYLSMGGGVSMALAKAGGPDIGRQARKHLPLKQCDVAVTGAGTLTAKFIFHGVTIDRDNYSYPDDTCIESITRRCLELADALRVKAIAFPALGTGVGKYPFQRAAEVMLRSIADHLSGQTTLREVTVALWSRGTVQDQGLNVFYERAVSLAALSTQTERLSATLDDLGALISRTQRPDIQKMFESLKLRLASTQEVLGQRLSDVDQMEELQRTSQLREVGGRAIRLAELSEAEVGWQDRQSELVALRTRVEGLATQLNIYYASLNKLEIERAQYGGIGIPLILENQVEVVRAELAQVETKLRDARRQLTEWGG